MMDEGLFHIIRPRAEYEEEVNMVFGCPTEFHIFDMDHMNDDLVQLHSTFYHMDGQVEHHYGSCRVCCRGSRGCSIVRRGIHLLLDNGTFLPQNLPSHLWDKLIQDTQDYSKVDQENPNPKQLTYNYCFSSLKENHTSNSSSGFHGFSYLSKYPHDKFQALQQKFAVN